MGYYIKIEHKFPKTIWNEKKNLLHYVKIEHETQHYEAKIAKLSKKLAETSK